MIYVFMNNMDSTRDHGLGCPIIGEKTLSHHFIERQRTHGWLEIPPCKFVDPFAQNRECMFTGVGSFPPEFCK